jgi:uncharacterized protein involved in exopolysaccharide biosynthesis
MTPAETPGAGTGAPPPTLAYLARRALRFWRLAALVFVVVVVGAVLYARQTWQPYQSQAVLIFDQGLPRETVAPDLSDEGGRIKEILYETGRIRTAVEKFDLFPEYSTPQAIEEVKKHLAFDVQPGGTFTVGYTGFTPLQAQSVLRELTETMIADHNRERSQRVRQTQQVLDAELAKLQEDVAAKETLLKDFLAKHPEAASLGQDLPGMDPAAVLIEQQLTQLRATARSRPAGSSGSGRSSEEILEARRLAETERDKSQRELEEKLATLTEAHPDVIVARERVTRARQEVSSYDRQLAAASGGGQGVSAEALEIKALEGRLRDINAASSRRINRNPRTLQLEVQLQALRNNLEEARKRQSTVQNEKMQTNVIEKLDSSGSYLRLRVHDPATLPGSPLQSRRRRIAMGGFALACLLAAGTALSRAMMSDRLFDRTDIAQLAGAGVLAVIPPVPKRMRGLED